MSNDVTHRVHPSTAVRHLDQAVRRLRDMGAEVVVRTCPDLGTVEPVPQPLRWILGRDAAHLDHALVRHLAGQTARLHLPLPEAPRTPGKDDATPEGWMARDGFHPGLLGYRQWGRQVAEAIG